MKNVNKIPKSAIYKLICKNGLTNLLDTTEEKSEEYPLNINNMERGGLICPIGENEDNEDNRDNGDNEDNEDNIKRREEQQGSVNNISTNKIERYAIATDGCNNCLVLREEINRLKNIISGLQAALEAMARVTALGK